MVNFNKITLLCVIAFSGFSCFSQDATKAEPPSGSTQTSDSKSAKKKCTIAYSEMPLVKNVRIGSTYDEVKSVFPEIENNEWFQKDYRVNKRGLFMIPAKEISDTDLKNDLRQISLNFEDDKVRIYNFIYKSSKWNSLETMIDDLSQTFNVDADDWLIFNGESLIMECKDFTVYSSHLKSGNKYSNSLAVHRK